jgi:excisionase family DNA binding protein
VGEPRTPPQQRSLLTIDEAATYLNVPARWVADAVRQRRLRCTRIGKHIRFVSSIWTSWSPPANSR